MATWSTVLAEIRTEAEESTASVWTDAQLLVLWNEGQRDFARKTLTLQDENYIVAATSTQSYDLPSYTIKPIAAYWGDDALSVTDRWDIGKSTTTGKPTECAFYEDAVTLWPIPNTSGTLTLLRYYEPTPLTAATNTVPFDSRQTAAIKNYVKARMYEQIQDFNTAIAFDQLYTREVQESEFERINFEDGAMVRMPTEVW